VLPAPDNLEAEVAVSDFCRRTRKPLCHAAVHGDTLVAQVRFLLNSDGSSPCLACGYGQQEWDEYYRETVFSCGGAPAAAEAPTMSVSFLCSLAADLALVQLLRFVLNLGLPVADTLLEYCGYTHATTMCRLVRNENCRCPHLRWSTAEVPRSLRDYTFIELAEATGLPINAVNADLAWEVDGHGFVDSAYCERCRHVQRVRRLAADSELVARCERCAAELRAVPFLTSRRVSLSQLGELANSSLGQLGADVVAWVDTFTDTCAVRIGSRIAGAGGKRE